MRKITIIFILFCIVFVSCSQRQIPFNKKQWMREKNRFYMTDSLIKKLNEDKNVFIQNISEIDDFKTNLPEIKKLLDEDNRLLKNQMWQYN